MGVKKSRLRMILCDGEKLPLTHLEVSTLRHALEHVIQNPHRFPVRVASESPPSVAHVRHVAGGLLHFLLTGDAVRDPPSLASWRARVLADEKSTNNGE